MSFSPVMHKKLLGWEKIREITVPEDTNLVTITGLDLDAHKAYMILLTIHNPSSGQSISMYYNGDLVATNYWHVRVYAIPNLGSARENNAMIGYLIATSSNVFDLLIQRPPDGYPRCFAREVCAHAGGLQIEWNGHERAVAENVTRIDFATPGNQIGAGSKIIVFGMNK